MSAKPTYEGSGSPEHTGRAWDLPRRGAGNFASRNLWRFADAFGVRWQIDEGCCRRVDITEEDARRLLVLLGGLQEAVDQIWSEAEARKAAGDDHPVLGRGPGPNW